MEILIQSVSFVPIPVSKPCATPGCHGTFVERRHGMRRKLCAACRRIAQNKREARYRQRQLKKG
jgi:hypothetical protein